MNKLAITSLQASSAFRKWTPVILLILALLATIPVAEARDEGPAATAPVNYGRPAESSLRVPKVLPDEATDDEILLLAGLPEPLLATGPRVNSDSKVVVRTLKKYEKRKTPHDLSALREFLQENSNSRWASGVRLNLLLLCYRNGYFSEALDLARACWEGLKEQAGGNARLIADRALAEYALMLARVGKMDELKTLVDSVEDRVVGIAAEQRLNQAREGLWHMTHKPETAFLCGPYALRNVGLTMGQIDESEAQSFLEGISSTKEGFTVDEVKAMGSERKVLTKAVERPVGGPVPIPSVVHWKIGHFAAILAERGGYFLVEDPTFRNQTWISLEALDEEASGVFLVPEESTDFDLPEASSDRARSLSGKGHSGNSDEDETDECDEKTGGCGPCSEGMPVYAFHTMLCSLTVSDTPLVAVPTAGPGLSFKLSYNQREAKQPISYTFTNFGANWVSDFVSYVKEVNPGIVGTNVEIRNFSGGGSTYMNYNSTNMAYGGLMENQARLVRKETGGILTGYEQEFQGGGKEKFSYLAGGRFFIKEVMDRYGNSLTFVYDDELNPGVGVAGRLKRIYTEEGLYAEFFYDESDQFLVSSIRDPWGREALFRYNPQGRLSEIEDAAGMSSSFVYDGSGFITAMTTPYGTTTFNSGKPKIGYGLIAWIEATDPMGGTERVEMNLSSSETGMPSSYSGPVPTGISVDTGDFDDRNSFYWNWKQWEVAKGLTGIAKYGKAHVYHWLQPSSGADSSTGVLQSEKPPLESWIWYNYPGQSSIRNVGTQSQPNKVARVLDDGTNQLTQFTYNNEGRVTLAVDPVGRSTRSTYFPGGVDLQMVERQLTGGTWVKVAEHGNYQPNGQPGWSKDGGGFQTSFGYNAAGQLETITDPLNEVTVMEYGQSPQSPDIAQIVAVKRKPTPGGALVTVSTSNRSIVNQSGAILLRETTTDADGLPIVTDYDELMRPVKTTYPDGSFSEILYDRLDPHILRDRNGNRTIQSYNLRRQLSEVRDAEGRVTTHEWCECGAMAALIDPEGRRTEWHHDLQNRVVKKIFPDLTPMDYVYETNTSRLKTTTDAKGQVKTMAYFKDDRIQGITYTNEEITTPNVSFTYDDLGRQWTRTDGEGVTTHGYHPMATGQLGAGQLASVDGPWQNDTVSMTYDAAGRLTGKVCAGSVTSLQIDYLGRVTDATNGLGTFATTYHGVGNRADVISYPGTLGIKMSYLPANQNLRPSRMAFGLLDGAGNITTQLQADSLAYAPNGNITDWTQERGAVTEGSQFSYGYDKAYQVKRATRTGLGGGFPAQEQFYSYDKGGNRISREVDGTLTKETPNALNQLVQRGGGGMVRVSGTLSEAAKVTVNGLAARMVDATTFEGEISAQPGDNTFAVSAVDGNGNTANKSYRTYVFNATPQEFSYDLVGNLISDERRTLEWDAENRLVAIDYLDGRRTEMAYDGLGRRVRIVEKSGATETSHKRFLWCDMAICEERDAANTTTKRFYSQGVEVGVAKYFYGRDHLGSVRTIVNASGVLVGRVDYDAWGRPTKEGAFTPDFGYTGHYWHQPSALFLAPFRAYDPETARWLSRDPLKNAEMKEGPNLYAYCANEPVNRLDPDGKTMYICYATAFGARGLLGYHTYIYDTEKGERCERSEKSRSSTNRTQLAKGPSSGDLCVPLPDQSQNDNLMKCCRETANDGAWIPKKNDCHDSLKRCFEKAGLKPPISNPFDNPRKFCQFPR